MRKLAIVVAAVLVAVACGAEEAAETTLTTDAQALGTSTTSTSIGGAAAIVTTTTVNSTTTTMSTTTTTIATVTTNPNLPTALGRTQIPWGSVGAGWYVALYDSSRAAPTGPGDVLEGPVVLYLVAPDGTRYETAVWSPDRRPWSIADVRPDGTAAVVVGTGATVDDTEWILVDLPTGATQTVYSATYPETTFGWGPYVAMTRPTGTNLVFYQSDGVDEWLERRSPGGSVLATLYEQPYLDAVSGLRWMYGYDGTSVLVTHHGGIALVQNDGTPVSELWVPMDHRCEPVRWWGSDTFLATCYGLGPGSAPLDEFGDPHTYFGQLWLLKTDGTAGSAMTALPTEPPIVVDFGHHDAWPAGSTTFVGWSGDCGASAAQTLNADGTTNWFTMSIPSTIVADGWSLIDVVGNQVAVYAWQGCAGDVGALFATDMGGTYTHDLVPVIGDARAVISVRGLAEVYP
ncbi:MAG: hypothetical protein OEY55_11660 [Acidimicrobiia bacterium]|nr:hypothetical protein [Acidimicrobiia bacterium]